MRTTVFLASALMLSACAQAEDTSDPAASQSPSSQKSADEVPVATGPLAPRDECASVEGLGALQTALNAAVDARDADALLKLVDEDVGLDFGGGSGHAELRTRLTSPDYRLWDEIDAALALGCGATESADGETYASWPWYFSKDVIPLDPFEAMIVTASDVPLRDAPSADAKQIGVVSWDYVQVTQYSEDPFIEVTTREGRKGYLPAENLRSLVDYRVVANKMDGEWKVTAIIAGD